MKSIKGRLVGYFMFIIIITVVIMEVSFINIVKHNYYKNLEDTLTNQIKVSSELYLRYFSDASLHENVLNNVDTFWKQTAAQVEIIDTSGSIIMDSIGIIPDDVSHMSDIKKALHGQKGTWIGNVKYDKDKVMAISYPLKSDENIVGAIRFITSLGEINKAIRNIALVFIIFGILVVFVTSAVSIFLANTIIGPLKEVTATAEKMASGNYKVECRKKLNDEIGKLSDTLNYMAQEILNKDQLKNGFILSVSHELRTPLTSIKGWAVTLKEGYENKEMLMDGLDIIEKESDRLTHMVEELLDFSKFISGKIIMEKRPVNVADTMEYIAKQLQARAARENISFNISYTQDIPTVHLDENRLKQVFVNLLDNAFRFTPSGGSVDFTACTSNSNLVFHVKDTGCGISREELPKVKEKFYKGKSSKSRNGIGLSICDEIIRLMNGSFDIKSELNKGTDVTIILPVQECG